MYYFLFTVNQIKDKFHRYLQLRWYGTKKKFFFKFCFFKYILHEYDRISVADTKYVNEISCVTMVTKKRPPTEK